MRKRLAVALGVVVMALLLLAAPGWGQSGDPSLEWLWIGGSTNPYYWDYTQIGTFSAQNNPNTREQAYGGMVDSQSVFLFGGFYTYYYNNALWIYICQDVWVFNTTLEQWAWMWGSSDSGVTSRYSGPANALGPGGRSAGVAPDGANGFYVFGGYGVDTTDRLGLLADLWYFSWSTRSWTFMGGPTAFSGSDPNYGLGGTLGTYAGPGALWPGPRVYPVMQFDTAARKLRMYAGWGMAAGTPSYAFGNLNDVWTYSVASASWTWEAGTSTTMKEAGAVAEAANSYVHKGTASSAAYPMRRRGAVSALDASGRLVVFGGTATSWEEEGQASAQYRLSDTWRFDFVSRMWTWLSGTSAGNARGQAVTEGTFDTTSYPSNRLYAGVTNNTQYMFVYGGYRANSDGSQVTVDDVWAFDLNLAEWAMIKGTTNTNEEPSWGAMNQASGSDTPGSRYNSILGLSAANKALFVVGGTDNYNNFNIYGDAFKLEPVCDAGYASEGTLIVPHNGGKANLFLPGQEKSIKLSKRCKLLAEELKLQLWVTINAPM